jgi:hypothetical protein
LRLNPTGRLGALLLVWFLASLPVVGSSGGALVVQVLPGRICLDSGQVIPSKRVRSVFLAHAGGQVAVPLGLVSPGDRVLDWEGGNLRVQARLVRGEFLDARHGELLLGRFSLSLPPKAEVLLNGQPCPPEDLPRGRAALARLDPVSGRVGRLEVVDPGHAGGHEASEILAVRVGLGSSEELLPRPARAGEVLHLELRAPEAGRAVFDVAGVVRGLAAHEVEPGLYRARLVVPPGLDAPNTFVLGRFFSRDGEPSVRVGPVLSLAPSPPRVLQFGPQGAAWGRSPVFARYESPGTVVDADRVRIWLDGRDVSARALRRVDLVWYAPAEGLASGLHRVRLQVVDAAGNRTQVSWRFRVEEVGDRGP